MVNMALFYDGAMLWTLFSGVNKDDTATTKMTPTAAITALMCWILMTKVIKLIPHFFKYPRDVVYFPFYVAFAYAHALVQLYALLTAWNISWGSRPALDSLASTRHRKFSVNGKRGYETEIADGEKEKMVLAMV